MWINPRLRDQHQPAQPPAERGERLATFPRGTGQELRLYLDVYEGRPFLSLRVWQQDPSSGDWWPQKGKGVSVRISESAGLAEILAGVADRVQSQGQGQRQGSPRASADRSPTPAAPHAPGPARAAAGDVSQGRPAPTDDGRPRYVDRRRRQGPSDWREQAGEADRKSRPAPADGFDEFSGHGNLDEALGN